MLRPSAYGIPNTSASRCQIRELYLQSEKLRGRSIDQWRELRAGYDSALCFSHKGMVLSWQGAQGQIVTPAAIIFAHCYSCERFAGLLK